MKILKDNDIIVSVIGLKILAIDYGDSRTGYAVSDELLFGAHTLEPLCEKNMLKVADYTAKLIKELSADIVVLGYPKNMNGSVGPRGEKTEQFKKLLSEKTDCNIILWDERLTTVSAHRLMNDTNTRGKKRKEKVDSVSAAFILQSYLDSIR